MPLQGFFLRDLGVARHVSRFPWHSLHIARAAAFTFTTTPYRQGLQPTIHVPLLLRAARRSLKRHVGCSSTDAQRRMMSTRTHTYGDLLRSALPSSAPTDAAFRFCPDAGDMRTSVEPGVSEARPRVVPPRFRGGGVAAVISISVAPSVETAAGGAAGMLAGHTSLGNRDIARSCVVRRMIAEKGTNTTTHHRWHPHGRTCARIHMCFRSW